MGTLSCHHEFSVNLNWSGKKNKTKQSLLKTNSWVDPQNPWPCGVHLHSCSGAVKEARPTICSLTGWGGAADTARARRERGPSTPRMLQEPPRGEGLCLWQLSSSGKWSPWSAHASSWGAPGDPSLNAFYLPLCESSFLIWVGKDFMCKVHIKKIWRIVILHCWVSLKCTAR